ncbi:hypothetical protein [Pandoraea sp. XY-2]|uniref:hypothetical protein n=1 Tax=Pandoraea sp. XY-2 TaxID=2518599 RepID=UPI0013EE8376|nr:hypothetical protein [Pandoraea sp. XY-2]
MGDGTGALTSVTVSGVSRPGWEGDDEDGEDEAMAVDDAAIVESIADGLNETGTDMADMIGSSFMAS